MIGLEVKVMEDKTVITGKQTVRALVFSTLGLITSITLSIAVLTICGKMFGISDIDPVIIGERVGLLVWLVGIVVAIVRTVKKNKKNSDTASMSRGTRRRFSSIQNKGVMIYYNLEAKIFKKKYDEKYILKFSIFFVTKSELLRLIYENT